MQETYMMIKPDGFEHREAIYKFLKEKGLIVKNYKEVKTNMEVMKLLLSHYETVIDEKGKDFDFVGRLFNSFYFGDFNIVPMHIQYDGEEDIIEYTRRLVGKTNPQAAAEGTIRHMFSNDNYDLAGIDHRLVNNVIHASDSNESAKKELEIWKDYIDYFDTEFIEKVIML